MSRQNVDKTEEEMEKKYKKRDKRKSKKMKVSGAGVKKLVRIIGGKG